MMRALVLLGVLAVSCTAAQLHEANRGVSRACEAYSALNSMGVVETIVVLAAVRGASASASVSASASASSAAASSSLGVRP
jgi:hypothetical protein